MEGENAGLVSMFAAGGSSLVGAVSSIAGGIQAQQAGNAAMQQAQQEATVAKAQAGAQISAEETNAGRELGKVAAGAGAAGVTSGSAMPVLSEDYAEAKIRSAYLRFNGQLAATEDLYQGQLAKYEGNQAFAKGFIGAASSVLSGASNIGQIGISKGWGSKGWGSNVPPPPPSP